MTIDHSAPPMKCLLHADDLMFVSQASQSIRDAGYAVQLVRDSEALWDESLDDVELVLVDLTIPAFDAQTVGERLRSRASQPLRLIAVGPHVHHAKLESAKQAGWTVYTRGQFHAAKASALR
jgi:DNA-binding response OmpR family regulator